MKTPEEVLRATVYQEDGTFKGHDYFPKAMVIYAKLYHKDQLNNSVIPEKLEEEVELIVTDNGTCGEEKRDRILNLFGVKNRSELFVSFARFAINYGKGSYATSYEDMFQEWCGKKSIDPNDMLCDKIGHNADIMMSGKCTNCNSEQEKY
jgi:hypothetical protein